MSQTPKVSVMIITYNHGPYIAQAIESVIEQKTNFDFEINIIEDCSTDNTQEIAKQYKEKYPDRINLYFNKKNIGFKVTQKNFIRGFRTLKGQYLAILEGDDYWCDKNKLQKQVDFLDNNPEYSACAHNTTKFYEDEKIKSHRFLYHGEKDIHSVEDIIYLFSMFHTTTLLYRNNFNGVPPRQFINPFSCDIFILIAHATFGPVKYFDDDMAMYRCHSKGRFSGLKMLDAWMFNIQGLIRYNMWLNFRYYKHFSFSIWKYCGFVLVQEKAGVVQIPFLLRLRLKAYKWFYRLTSHFADFISPGDSPWRSSELFRHHYNAYEKLAPPSQSSFYQLLS